MRGRILQEDPGFTLIEVVVVMAVITILAGVATLSISSYIPSLRLKRASQELQLQIQKARLEAVRRNRPCLVAFHMDFDGRRYSPMIWIDEPDPLTGNYNGGYDVGESIVFRQDVKVGTYELADYGGIRFDSSQGGGDGVTFVAAATSGENAFRFNLRGLSDKGGSIHLLSSSGRRKTIDITLGGAIRIR